MPRGPRPEFRCQGWCALLHPDEKRPQRRRNRLLAGLRGWGIGNLQRADCPYGGVGVEDTGQGLMSASEYLRSWIRPQRPKPWEAPRQERSEIMILPLGSALCSPSSPPIRGRLTTDWIEPLAAFPWTHLLSSVL